MSVGHAHSHRPRRPTHRSRPDMKKPHDWMKRVERRRQRVAEGPREVVVQVPGLSGRPVAGQRQGRFVVGGGPSRFVVEALIRQAAEAAQAASR